MNSATRGGVRLVFDAIEGLTHTVEQMHETIARRPLPWASAPEPGTRAHGLIAAGVYRAIRGVNGALRAGTDGALGLLPDSLAVDNPADAELRVAAALNGALGDHLESTGNALAIPMSLVTERRRIQLTRRGIIQALPQAGPHPVVLVHGLGLSELNWRRGGGPGLGQALMDEVGYTPLYLRYNSGRHIHVNARELAGLLDDLCDAWPVPIQTISLVGHSMGGLVIRSACHQAGRSGRQWLGHLRRVACLGSPHHGAPLEKAGHLLDVALRRLPYTAPLALGRVRSAGIKDLRHGSLLLEDWDGRHPDQPGPDSRIPLPLPPDVDHFFVAASVGEGADDPMGRMLGDLLVRVESAVGAHRDNAKAVPVPAENCRVFHTRNHFDLLNDREVREQLIRWFHSPGADPHCSPAVP